MDGAEREKHAEGREQTGEAVACPFCAEAIKPQAKVCKHCGRDFFLIQPLLEQVRTLSKRVEELESGMVDLAEDTKRHVSRLATSSASQTAAPAGPSWTEKVPAITRKTAVCASLVWMLAVDYLVNFQLDASLLLIQAAIVIGPLVGGFLCRKETPQPLLADLTAAVMLAIVAVMAMTYLDYRITRIKYPDQLISLLPEDWADWKEEILTLLAVSCAFMGGAFARKLSVGFPRGNAEDGFTFDASRFIVKKLHGSMKPAEMEGKLKSVEAMLTSLLTIGTTGVAIAAALGKIFASN